MSTIDRALADGQAGAPLDGEYHRQRSRLEDGLAPACNRLAQACVEAQGLRAALDEDRDTAPAVDISAQLALATTLVPSLKIAVQRAEQALAAFRLRHALTREPQVPDPLMTGLILGVLVFVEAGINASFFHNAHMVATPFAALLVSLLISLTNITVSTCAGYFIGCWIDYGGQAADADAPAFAGRRALARDLLPVYLIVIALFHATVGLVRAQESLERVVHAPAAYLQLLHTPEALFLVLTGLCLSWLAFHKGAHGFDDPYPGYGACHRAVIAQREALSDLFEDLSAEIADRFDDAEATLAQAAKRRRQQIQRYNRRVHACLAARRVLEREVRAAESGLRAQIAQLAGYHRAVRGQDRPPAAPIPEQLVSFAHLLKTELPAFLGLPPPGDAQARLAAALARLQQLFDRAELAPHCGDPGCDAEHARS